MTGSGPGRPARPLGRQGLCADELVLPRAEPSVAEALGEEVALATRLDYCRAALALRDRWPEAAAALEEASALLRRLHPAESRSFWTSPFVSYWLAGLRHRLLSGSPVPGPSLVPEGLFNLLAFPLARSGTGQAGWFPLRPGPGRELRFPGEAFHLERSQAEGDGLEACADGAELRIRSRDGWEASVSTPAGEVTRGGEACRAIAHPTDERLGFLVDNTEPAVAEQLSLLRVEADPAVADSLRVTDRRDSGRAAPYLATLDRAGELLLQVWPEMAGEIRALVRLLVPLHKEPGLSVSSSFTCTNLRGAVFMTVEETEVLIGEMLVHESGHVKLDDIMRLDALVVGNTAERYRSPWKEVPRPLTGILHAAFSYLRVAGYYRRLLDAGPSTGVDRDAAAGRVRGLLGQLHAGLRILRADESLTPLGRDLVRTMGRAVADLSA